jgi:carboxymethylenebutenolidase
MRTFDAIQAETVTIWGDGGDPVEAYLARPLGPGPFGSVVVIHHLPGYDGATKEITRTFATLGFLAVCPNLFYREAPDVPSDDAAALARAAGGVPDSRLVGDVAGASAYLRGLTSSNGRVGVIGYCSGGRQAFLAACSLPLDAAVDCYGGYVVGTPPEGSALQRRPLLHKVPDLSCPLLGLFGAEDSSPSTAEVEEFASALADAGKAAEFHTYADAGHAFFAVDRPSYRPSTAMDGWRKIAAFFHTHLD